MSNEQISKEYAVEQVRCMASQFADLYFMFVKELRERFGDDTATEIATRVLFLRAQERANEMIVRAEASGTARIWENIGSMTDVPFLGWCPERGRDHCPYGEAWNKRIKENPWFRPYASLYCDVTDTTIGEIFTADHSHKLYKNVVLGDDSCEREYFPDENVKSGKLTYGK